MTDGSLFLVPGAPPWVVLAVAFAIVFSRAQGTYWLGRGLAAGTVRSRWSGLLESERAERSVASLHRWGPAAVTFSFLLVGVQTVVLLAAGYTRMAFWRFLAAMVPGCALWAVIWSTVGTAAFYAAVFLAARSPIGLAAGAIALVGLATFLVLRRRGRRVAVATAD